MHHQILTEYDHKRKLDGTHATAPDRGWRLGIPPAIYRRLVYCVMKAMKKPNGILLGIFLIWCGYRNITKGFTGRWVFIMTF